MKKFILTCLAVMICFAIGAHARAQDVSVQAQVSSRYTDINSAIQYSVTISGQQDVPPVILPEMEGFDVEYRGPSTQVTIINGQYNASVTYSYILFPKKTGTFTIPSVDVKINNTTYQTESIDVQVGAAGSQNPNAPDETANQPNLEDKIGLVVKVPQSDVYLNQRVPVKVMLLISDVLVRDIQMPEFKEIGISVSEISKPRQYQQNVKGVRYDILEFDAYVYPTRTGEVEVGPAMVEMNMLYKTARPSGRSARIDSIFNDDFFGDLFDRYERRPVRAVSEKITLNVKPLPQGGKPDDFSGAVGQYDFQAEVSPVDLKVGDPITLRMRIAGDGNISSVKFPKIRDTKNFKFYDASIKEEGQQKSYEQVLIPLSDKVKQVPALDFTYFDTKSGQYRRITKGPFDIQVAPSEGGQAQVIDYQPQQEVIAPQKLGRDLVFIKENIGQLRPKGKRLTQTLAFQMTVGFLFVLWLGGFIFARHRRRLQTDVAYARRLKAPRVAQKHIHAAGQRLNSNDSRAFYDEIHRTLQVYFSHKWHLPVGAVNLESIEKDSRSASWDAGQRDDLRGLFAKCEEVRFANKAASADEMRADLGKLKTLIDSLERKKR